MIRYIDMVWGGTSCEGPKQLLAYIAYSKNGLYCRGF